MNAAFEQKDNGHTYIRLTDVASFEEGDGIAIGKSLNETQTEYLCATPFEGVPRWSGRMERLKAKSAWNGEEAVFLLPSAYVDSMSDGFHTLFLLGRDGMLKDSASLAAFDIRHSLLKDTGHELGIKEKGTGQPKEIPINADAPDGVKETDGTGTKETGSGGQTENPASTSEAAKQNTGQNTGGETTSISNTTKAGSKAPLIVGLLAAALLAAGGGYMLSKGDTAKASSSAPVSAPADEVPAPTTAEPAAPAAPAEAEKPAEPSAPAETEKPAEPSAPAETEKPAEPSAPAEAEKSAEPSAPAETEKPAEPEIPAQPAPETASPVPAPTALDRVKEFMQGDRDPEAAMKLASELDLKTDADKDAAARLFYLAAERGHAEGLKRYLDCIDPCKPAWGSMPKLGDEAWRLYEQLPGGENDRQALKQWVQEEASKGNKEAAEWLKNMR